MVKYISLTHSSEERLYLKQYTQLIVLDLSKNRITRDAFQEMDFLYLLRKLDISECELDFLPNQTFWRNRLRLTTLFAHRNRLRMEHMMSLRLAPKLKWLTLYYNEGCVVPNYRKKIVIMAGYSTRGGGAKTGRKTHF